MSGDPVDRLREAQAVDYDAFADRVAAEADIVKEHLDDGTFDNPHNAVGLEYEFYGVDEERRVRRLPRSLLDYPGFEKELGLHNAELSTSPQPCNEAGLAATHREVEAKLAAAQDWATDAGVRLVSDGMWTIGPAEQQTWEYLGQATHEEGLTLAINVSNAVRYHGFASVDRPVGGRLDVPGVDREADNAGPVSLTTSIQPHFQLRRAADLPDRFRYALRVAGPLVALAANSPFLPPELYDDPGRTVLVETGWAENRIPVYEDMMNPPDSPPKVRFPEDIETPTDAVDRIVEDRTIVPASIDAGERFDDAFVHFRHKHGSFWRWVRPVFDGASPSTANTRIEFRPLPAQPTVADTVAFLAAFAGVMTALPRQDHPVGDLSWERARENFYAAARDGIDADLVWITSDGDRTTDSERCFDDLLDAAVDGLCQQGLAPEKAQARLGALRDRARRRRTPAAWKRAQVARLLAAGTKPVEAVRTAQRRYLDRQATSLLDGDFRDWPDP